MSYAMRLSCQSGTTAWHSMCDRVCAVPGRPALPCYSGPWCRGLCPPAPPGPSPLLAMLFFSVPYLAAGRATRPRTHSRHHTPLPLRCVGERGTCYAMPWCLTGATPAWHRTCFILPCEDS